MNISTTLRLQCLFPRKKGQPKWEVSTTYRKYPQSWVEIDLPGKSGMDAYEVIFMTISKKLLAILNFNLITSAVFEVIMVIFCS